MKVVVFGATGMVGQGVMRECLLDPGITSVIAVGRRQGGQRHEKLRDLVVADVADLSSIEGQLGGLDACFFCLGVSSLGMNEADYTRVTYELTMSVARTLLKVSPGLTFVFVSGASTDSTEQGKTMWARVKGKTENALLAMPFKAKYMFRPGFIRPLHGIKAGTRWVRAVYAAMAPLTPLIKALAPGSVTSTEAIGRAMIEVARRGAPKAVLETVDIEAVAKA
jgi:uncharacterized protein YbjT (DUF2867 family)